MRTRNGTATKDDLAVSLDTILGGFCGLGHFSADSMGFRTRFIEQDPLDYSTENNCEVRTLEDTRCQVGDGSRVTWDSVSDVRDS